MHYLVPSSSLPAHFLPAAKSSCPLSCSSSSSCNSFCSLSVLLSQCIQCSSNCSCSYSIVQCLVLEDRILVSKQGVRQYLIKLARKPGSGLPPKLSPAILRLIDYTMCKDNETTATQLQSILATRQIYVSLSTIVRKRSELGWTYRGSAYCQLIRHANKLGMSSVSTS